MEKLIPVINKLQDVFQTVGAEEIELPQIVVVGSQSSGKSSVLESLVGRSFLPRGTGTVTRCPLIFQLMYAPKGSREHRSEMEGTLELEEWCKFLHKPDKIYTDFSEVLREIESETDRKAGTNKNIVDEPINLKVYSGGVLNLTVVDLPGIVKVPAGDQPEDIEGQIKSLINSYIKNPNCIILAVSPANNDMANSESLKIAKEVDPEGSRTLAVVTKLDLMDAGTDAEAELSGRVIEVKLGIIGVVNRSQLDVQNSKSIKKSLRDEANFFKQKYPKLASRNGTPFLAEKLNRLLMHHIHDCLPELKSRVDQMVAQFQERRNSFGDEISDIPETVLTTIQKFVASFEADLNGTSEDKELCGGARISCKFHENFRDEILSIGPLTGLTDDTIHDAIRNAAALDLPIFIPEAAFKLLVKKQIRKLQEPCDNCVGLVHEEMRTILLESAVKMEQQLFRFPKLKAKLIDVVINILDDSLDGLCKDMKKMVATELSYINTQHPDFEAKSLLSSGEQPLGSGQGQGDADTMPGAIPSHFGGSALGEDQKHRDCRIIKKLIKSYFVIVQKKIQDSVPKMLMLSLVNHVKEKLGTELIKELVFNLSREELNNLFIEPWDIAQQRESAIGMLEALGNAKKIISEINGLYLD